MDTQEQHEQSLSTEEQPQVIDITLLNETQDTQITQIPEVQHTQQITISNKKFILALLILNFIVSCCHLFVLGFSALYSAIELPTTYFTEFPEEYIFVVITLLIIAVFGLVLMNYFYVNKILFVISSSLGLLFMTPNCYLLVIHIYDSIATHFLFLHSIIVTVTILILIFVQFVCSIALAVIFAKNDAKTFNVVNINLAKQKYSTIINISIIVIETIVIFIVLLCFICGLVIYISSSIPLGIIFRIFILFSFFMFGAPIISIISSSVQLKTNSKTTASIALGANLFTEIITIW